MTVYPGPRDPGRGNGEPASAWQPERLPPLPGDEWKGPMNSEREQPELPVAEPADGSGAHEHELPPRIRLAFAPLHKRAFGTGIGAAAALVVVALTLFHVLLDAPGAPDIGLLAQYFYGYRVSWLGVLIGGAWAFGVGFVAGWFFAFCRNLTFAVLIFVRRTRAELAQTRAFLDHI